MIRTFIAFELPDEIKFCLGEAVSVLKQKNRAVKWVRPEGLHVTVKFLGSIDESLIKPLSRDLDTIAAAQEPLHVSLSGIGAFPDRKRTRVIWAGLKGDTAIMAEIARQVEDKCAGYGMKPETRPFLAHVTMGRLKVPSVVDLAQEIREREFIINKVVLFKSELSSSGARYVVLHWSVLGQEKGE